jgi:hydroxylamine reductase (hybrid-cluster protein)
MMWRRFGAILVVAIAAVLVTAMVVGRLRSKPPMHSFNLKYLSGAEAADLVNSNFGPSKVEGWSEHGVFIRGSNRDRDGVAELLAKEDKPKPQVALKFQLIEADGFATQDSAIARVESVLRNLFRFRGYRLVTEAYVTAKEESEASQSLIGSDGVGYDLAVTIDAVTRREGKASAEVTAKLYGRSRPILETSVNLPDGQTVVLGTTRIDGSRGALILVVTPTIR